MSSLSGKTFCVTGTLTILRGEFEDLLRSNGGTVHQAVSKNITHLICASDEGSSKAMKALKLGIPAISEKDVREMIAYNGNPAAHGGGIEVVDLVEEDVSEKKRPVSHASQPPAKKAKSNDIEDGETAEVFGSGPKPHIMKNVGGVYSCSCPAWRFQKLKIDERTCKHLREYRGDNVETARVGSVGAGTPVRKEATSTGSPASAQKKKTTTGAGLFEAHKLMLAHSWNPERYTPSEFLMSEKLDGMRALWNGQQLVSRAGNPIDAPDFFVANFPTNMALDGELFCGRGQFSETVSIARRKNGGELWRKMKYVVFDAPSVDSGFEGRLAAIPTRSSFIQIHPHTPCRNLQHLEGELKRVEGLNGEGIMMRKKGSRYDPGRSHELLKVKTFHDDEALVHDHQAGKGKHFGRMGALLCRLRNGTEFKVGTGFKDEQRENPPPVGSVITFRYFEKTKAGVPRFPSYVRMRPDAEASEFIN